MSLNVKDEKTMSKFAAQAGRELREGFDKTKTVLFGKATEEEQKKRWDSAVNDVTKNISAYAPKARSPHPHALQPSFLRTLTFLTQNFPI